MNEEIPQEVLQAKIQEMLDLIVTQNLEIINKVLGLDHPELKTILQGLAQDASEVAEIIFDLAEVDSYGNDEDDESESELASDLMDLNNF